MANGFAPTTVREGFGLEAGRDPRRVISTIETAADFGYIRWEIYRKMEEALRLRAAQERQRRVGGAVESGLAGEGLGGSGLERAPRRGHRRRAVNPCKTQRG